MPSLVGRRWSRSVLILASIFTGLTACSSVTAPESDLARARERWAERGPTSYTYTLTRGCECLREMTGPVVITVQDGAVVSRVYVSTGTPVVATYQSLFPSIEGVFNMIESAIQADADRVDVTYDAILGAPVTIAIDYNAIRVDDEFFVQVTNLTAP